MSTDQHRQQAAGQFANCAVLTISDTRSKSDDDSGRIIHELLQGAGHVVSDYRLVKDEPAQIEAQLRAWVNDPATQVICCTGGTGLARRDATIEVAQRLLEKKIDGFGELFRMLSWDQVGAAAMLSRAVAGLAGRTLVFVMPGSSRAVTLAMEKLIVPELPHLLWEQQR